jgi:DNA sulfur modification protein DndE
MSQKKNPLRLALAIFNYIMSIESFRVSEKGRTQLSTLKRRTGMSNWNTICRWAFCLSLSEKKIPPEEDIPSDSSLEMTWKTFAGQNDQVYLAILRQRLITDDLNIDDEFKWFRIHLHRGISYLTSKVKTLDDLLLLIK